MDNQSMLEKLPTLTSGLLLLMKDRNSAFKESNLNDLQLRTKIVLKLMLNLNVERNVSSLMWVLKLQAVQFQDFSLPPPMKLLNLLMAHLHGLLVVMEIMLTQKIFQLITMETAKHIGCGKPVLSQINSKFHLWVTSLLNIMVLLVLTQITIQRIHLTNTN